MGKNKRLILHIGTIKTGSSSIQTSLGSARDVLLKHNIHYPSLKPFNHTFSFPPVFMDNPERAPIFRKSLKSSGDKHRKVQRYRDNWVKEIESCEKDNFIISAEGFSQSYFTRDAVRRLKTFVERYFEQMTIIVYVRHYDAWISSQMQQVVRNGGPSTDITEVANHLLSCPPNISFQKSLKKWVKAFGRENLVARPFDPQEFYHGSLLADFLHSCKLPVDVSLIPEIRSNESLGKNAVAFLQKYNQTYPLFINRSVNKERGMARRGTPGYLYKNLSADEKFKLELVYSPEQAQRFNEEIDYVNQFFTGSYQFHHVSSESKELKVPSADEIPVDFYVELINNYNKQLDELLDRNAFLREKLKVFRTPLVAQFFHRLPFLQSIFRKAF